MDEHAKTLLEPPVASIAETRSKLRRLRRMRNLCDSLGHERQRRRCLQKPSSVHPEGHVSTDRKPLGHECTRMHTNQYPCLIRLHSCAFVAQFNGSILFSMDRREFLKYTGFAGLGLSSDGMLAAGQAVTIAVNPGVAMPAVEWALGELRKRVTVRDDGGFRLGNDLRRRERNGMLRIEWPTDY